MVDRYIHTRVVQAAFFVALLCSFQGTAAFSQRSSNVKVESRQHDNIRQTSLCVKKKSKASPPEFPAASPEIEYSSFWGTTRTIQKKDETTKSKNKPPCVPSMDRLDGPLPPGAYQIFGDPSKGISELKPTCRLSVAVDLFLPVVEPYDVVRRMQRLIDAGFNTFQLASPSRSVQGWGEENVYRRLVQDTPAHVIKDCHLVVPLSTPSANTIVSSTTVREAVLEKLHRIGGDAIDTLQLECKL
jgi:hypothetical protein